MDLGDLERDRGEILSCTTAIRLPYVVAPVAMRRGRVTPQGMPTENAADREIDQLFDELDQLLKNPDISEVLASRGVNTSLAMLAADGLRAYLKGNKRQAAEDFATVADEISSRMAMSGDGAEDISRRPS